MIVILPIFQTIHQRLWRRLFTIKFKTKKVFRYCYKTRGLFVHKVVPKSTESEHFTRQIAICSKTFFRALKVAKIILKIINTTTSAARIHILGIICSPRLTVSLTEEIMFTAEYPCIFLRQIETIVYLMHKNERKNKQTYKNYSAKQNLN